MAIHGLESYDISPERGFLCKYEAGEVRLPGAFAEAREVAMDLPRMLPSGRTRSLLMARLPDTIRAGEVDALSDAEARMAMVHYSFMVQAFVWGEMEAPAVLPRMLAQPICWLADRLGQQPLLPYSGYVLDNWARFDADGPVDLDNIYMIQNFASGVDEAWFVLVHVAIEAAAGEALAAFGPVIEGVAQDDADTVRRHLEAMAGVWARINAIFDRMPERCDPYIYFERVRPYIHGWKDNPALPDGIVYEGVSAHDGKPVAFRGQTGSQSSIVPSMDALLGVGHAADPMRTYLDELHIYRPPQHRKFIDDVREQSRLRAFVRETGQRGLIDAYNGLIQAVADFRSRHLEYAASYINRQSRMAAGNDTSVGTGGTPFMKYLKKHRDETQANMLELA